MIWRSLPWRICSEDGTVTSETGRTTTESANGIVTRFIVPRAVQRDVPPALRPYLEKSGTLGATVKPSGIHESGIRAEETTTLPFSTVYWNVKLKL